MPAEEVLAEAQKLYDEGKWLESEKIIASWFDGLTIAIDEEMMEARRLRGWNYYYIATKGLGDKKASLAKAKEFLEAALEIAALGRNYQTRISCLNGLPLVFWLQDKKEDAWAISHYATNEFPDEPSIWNTRAILCRWAKNFEESVKVCEIVYETALARKDYRTAGHGKHNKADALKELGRIKEAKDEYAAAIGLYKKFEETTGQSAKFHIDGVEKKLNNLK